MTQPRLDTSLELLTARLDALREGSVLATIVSTEGSTYRKAGARMLVEANGRMTGLLSGGCLERDLAEHAQSVLTTGVAAIAQYDMRTTDDLIYGIGAGCEGAMRVLLERVNPGSSVLAELLGVVARVGEGRSAALAVVHTGPTEGLGTRCVADGDAALTRALSDCLATQRSGNVVLDGQRQAWVEYLAPPPHVLICGAGPDAVPLVHLLAGLGFLVTVADHRPLYLDTADWRGAKRTLGPAGTLAQRLRLQRFDAAVVMSHHLESDATYLSALADSPIPHIGLLGPRARRERLLGMVGSPGAEALRGRLRGPVGLDIGAPTPESIALAIAAELHALFAGRPGTLAPAIS